MKKLILPLAVFAFATAGCDNLEKVDHKMNFKLDPALSQANKDLLRSDVAALENYNIQAESGSYFAKSFGGTSGANVLQYMDDRVNYIVPELDDLSSRIKLGWFSLPSDGSNSSSDPTASDKRAVTMALNIGFALWMANEANPLPINLNFQIGGTSVPLTSPRVGIVELGQGYTMAQTPRGTKITPVIRTTTLVHEARHSDCTGGLGENDLAELKAGQIPDDHECGHMHVNCPAGHPLSGLPACDDLPWGAYSIEGVFAASLGANCANCTEDEKQQALAAAADAFSRVTVIDGMLDGKAGDPDMSSTDKIRKSDPSLQQLLGAIQAEQSSPNPKSGIILAE
jgi:hypothetical protein